MRLRAFQKQREQHRDMEVLEDMECLRTWFLEPDCLDLGADHPFLTYVALGKLFNLSQPQFPYI